MVTVINKTNEGHGPTIMGGYHKALELSDWIFQIDSDGELSADDFEILWNKRKDYDFLFGIRQGRDQPLGRSVISMISRYLVRILCGKGVADVNVPFRLMRNQALKHVIAKIPDSTFAPNVAIAGLAVKYNYTITNIPVSYNIRQTGCCSIVKWNLVKCAVKSFVQTAVILMKGNP
jgi:glycosyltransferase involved in cell wall biosynthesis